ESLFLKQKIAIRTFHKELIFTESKVNHVFNQYNKVEYLIEELNDQGVEIVIKVSLKIILNQREISKKLIIKFVFVDGLLERVYETTFHPHLTRIMCVVTYDGSMFNGFQRQPNQLTIQGEIEKGLFYLTKEKITIHSSGRTDKGVHALNQVFHFDTISNIEPNEFYRVLNNYLPSTIHLKSSHAVSQTFHSRYDSIQKEYCYKLNLGDYDPIQRNYEWAPGVFNLDLFKAELTSIIGTNDFTSFTKTKEDKEMIRTIFDVSFDQREEYLNCYITGNGFLHFMVRYLIGTAVEIAKGNVSKHLLDFMKDKDASKVRWKAPSSGLYLSRVSYNNDKSLTN
ncbi:MAG: tRNA pseudouridine(38-40) synthase TruA, partial [Bacilli bacterium]|nr:tRNA pseudouridine(38-40) synthase TruA [Bacilli bacterium]